MQEEAVKNAYEILPVRLLPWYEANARDLPWRQAKDPYPVWVSEVMLQQTRVEAVLKYYDRFLRELPDIHALSRVPEDRLLKLWEGLGYYSRARNLQRAAQMIMNAGGGFPGDYAGIRSLPGVGEYTADAIASICFGMPTPAVDGNVLRLTARLTAMEESVDDPGVRREIRQRLGAVCPADAGMFTQALMELGATVCIPNGEPLCKKCPLVGQCAAYQAQEQRRYPVRAKRKARRAEEKTVFLLALADGRVALRKRPAAGLLAGMFELPNVEGHLSPQQALTLAESWGVEPLELLGGMERVHIFTHLEWHMTCYGIRCGREGTLSFGHAGDYPLPGALSPFLKGWCLSK